MGSSNNDSGFGREGFGRSISARGDGSSSFTNRRTSSNTNSNWGPSSSSRTQNTSSFTNRPTSTWGPNRTRQETKSWKYDGTSDGFGAQFRQDADGEDSFSNRTNYFDKPASNRFERTFDEPKQSRPAQNAWGTMSPAKQTVPQGPTEEEKRAEEEKKREIEERQKRREEKQAEKARIQKIEDQKREAEEKRKREIEELKI
eukprot:UN01987